MSLVDLSFRQKWIKMLHVLVIKNEVWSLIHNWDSNDIKIAEGVMSRQLYNFQEQKNNIDKNGSYNLKIMILWCMEDHPLPEQLTCILSSLCLIFSTRSWVKTDKLVIVGPPLRLFSVKTLIPHTSESIKSKFTLHWRHTKPSLSAIIALIWFLNPLHTISIAEM